MSYSVEGCKPPKSKFWNFNLTLKQTYLFGILSRRIYLRYEVPVHQTLIYMNHWDDKILSEVHIK